MMDEARFQTFYELTARPLSAYLLRLTGDRSLSDDISQEAFTRMLQRELDDPSDLKLKSYLFTTATNLCRDYWRSRRTTDWEAESAADRGSNHHERETDLRQTFETAFESLTPQQRSLVWLSYVEGYSHREVAAMLDLKEKSVRVLLFRAKKKLSGVLTAVGIGKEDLP